MFTAANVYFWLRSHVTNQLQPCSGSSSFPLTEGKKWQTTQWLLRHLHNSGTITCTRFCQPKTNLTAKPEVNRAGMCRPSTGGRGAINHTAVPGSKGQGRVIVRQRETAKLGTLILYATAFHKGTEVTPLPGQVSRQRHTQQLKEVFGLPAEGAVC